MVDGGGKRLSEERRTGSPSIRAYSRPESFPQGCILGKLSIALALGDCPGYHPVKRNKRSSSSRVDIVAVPTMV
jgi:hypothetical protein